MFLYMYPTNVSRRCTVCGRIFQGVARGVVCCGMVAALLTGQPTRLQPQPAGSLPEQVVRVASVSTATATTITASPFYFSHRAPPNSG